MMVGILVSADAILVGRHKRALLLLSTPGPECEQMVTTVLPPPLASCKIKQFYYLKKIATRCVLGAGTQNIKWFSPGHRGTTEPVVFSYYDNRELQVRVIWRGNDLPEFKLHLQGNSFICFESGILCTTEANFFQLIALLPGWIPKYQPPRSTRHNIVGPRVSPPS